MHMYVICRQKKEVSHIWKDIREEVMTGLRFEE